MTMTMKKRSIHFFVQNRILNYSCKFLRYFLPSWQYLSSEKRGVHSFCNFQSKDSFWDVSIFFITFFPLFYNWFFYSPDSWYKGREAKSVCRSLCERERKREREREREKEIVSEWVSKWIEYIGIILKKAHDNWFLIQIISFWNNFIKILILIFMIKLPIVCFNTTALAFCFTSGYQTNQSLSQHAKVSHN